MPNDIVPFDQFQAPSPIFAKSTVDVTKFSGGIQASFAILTIKGKEWGVRFRGVTTQLTAPNPMAGNALMPVQFLDVVIVDAAATISKVYYIHGYKDGERTPPDCWSANGVAPDPASPHRQSNTCRGCPHNVFGSKIGDGGQKGKACPDNKRLAIVPVSDIKNEALGGPVMLRLPPGSFGLYSDFVGKLASKHYPPFAVATRLTFSPGDAYPKIVFTPLRPLNDAEGALVLEIQQNPQLERMLTDPAIGAFADAEAGDTEAGPGVPPPPQGQQVPPPPVVTPPPAQQAPPPPPPPVVTQPPVPPNQASAPVMTGFGVAAPVAGTSSGPAQAQPAPAPSASWGGGTPAPTQVPPPAQQPQDDLAPPAFLQRQPPAQQATQEPQQQPLPPVNEVLTPEQMRIKELEAQLAAAKAPKTTRKRTQPVGPPTNGAGAEPVVATAQPVTPPGNGAAPPAQTQPQPVQPPGEGTVGNAIADRIASLVGQKN